MLQSDHMLYQEGWRFNGDWICPLCKSIIGKNLLGEKPIALAREHIMQCGKCQCGTRLLTKANYCYNCGEKKCTLKQQ